MKFKQLIAAFSLVGLSACSGIDCSLDSIVVWTLAFYDSETEEALSLPWVLTVDAEGAGTLFNKGTKLKSMELPLSHSAPTDTFYLRWTTSLNSNKGKESDNDSDNEYEATDILYIDHTNKAHFDAIDCPAAVFHDITGAKLVPHTEGDSPVIIDSIHITRSIVDYNDVENIRLYLSPAPVADDSGSRRK